jgi:ComF family protein
VRRMLVRDRAVSGARRVQQWALACVGAFDALAFPWSCAVCGEDVEASPLCGTCRGALTRTGGRACARCAMPIGPWENPQRACAECRTANLGFDRAIALGPYEGVIREMCLRLKHEHEAWLAPWLVDLLVEARPAMLEEPSDSVIVPVPLHWRRHWRRRYNQAEALALRLGRRLGRPVSRALRRVQPTPPLAGMGREARAELMRDVFRAKSARCLQGRTVLLVDDILTTGATCGSAARCLKAAGASRVVVVVLGRAQGRP